MKETRLTIIGCMDFCPIDIKTVATALVGTTVVQRGNDYHTRSGIVIPSKFVLVKPKS